MSRVDVLLAAMDSLAVKFIEFTRIIKNDDKKVAVFFEGEDEKYYSIRLATRVPDVHWGGVKCGGKSKVIELRNRIRNHSEYKDSKCMFFVDADFDDNSAIKELRDLYVTPGYSVENFYISDSAFLRILSAEFGVAEHGDEGECFNNAYASFVASKKLYLDAIEDFNCWLRSCRTLERAGVLTSKLNLNNLDISDLVSIEINGCARVYDPENIEALFSDTNFNVPVDKEKSRPVFERETRESAFRGKQQLDFMRIFLTHLKTDRCKRKGRVVFNLKGNVKMNLTKGNCLSELSQYADTPPCLLDFLDRYKQEFKEPVVL